MLLAADPRTAMSSLIKSLKIIVSLPKKVLFLELPSSSFG